MVVFLVKIRLMYTHCVVVKRDITVFARYFLKKKIVMKLLSHLKVTRDHLPKGQKNAIEPDTIFS